MGNRTEEGFVGRRDEFTFDPDKLVVVTDHKHVLYDPRAETPDDDPALVALAEDILIRGTLESVKCRRDGNRLEVVAGRRRTLAGRIAKRLAKARKLGVEILTPVTIVKGTDLEIFGIMVAENAHRADETPSQRASKMQRFVTLGAALPQVAAAFNCTVQTVKNTLALLDVGADVRAAIDAREIPATTASDLAATPRAKQTETLRDMRETGATKGKAAKNAVRAARVGKPITADVERMIDRRTLEKVKAALEAGVTNKSIMGDLTGKEAIKFLRWILTSDTNHLAGSGQLKVYAGLVATAMVKRGAK